MISESVERAAKMSADRIWTKVAFGVRELARQNVLGPMVGRIWDALISRSVERVRKELRT